MNFKKIAKLTVEILMTLVFILGFGATIKVSYASAAFINPNSKNAVHKQSNKAVWDLGEVLRWSICVESENVIVRRGGKSFQIEVSRESQDSYLLLDENHVITKRFQEREIALQRKEGLGDESVFSSTIVITVPDSAQNVLYDIITTSGNISIDHSHADKILAVSETGKITITNSFANDYIIAESEAGTVKLKNTVSDGEIYIKDKNTPEAFNGGGLHRFQSGYSEDEFAAMLKAADQYAVKIAKKKNLGTPQYAGEIFDLDVVKGTVSFHFDLDGGKYTTLSVDVNSDHKITGYRYWH